MAKWVQEQVPLLLERHPNQKFLPTALFHEPNSFGEFLHRQLTHELQPQVRAKKVVLYNFEVTDQVEFADLMPQLWCR